MAASTGMAAVMHYLGYESAAAFRGDWSKLSDESKVQLKDGVGTFDKDTGKVTGTLTY